jgi:penicillin-binding protein 2
VRPALRITVVGMTFIGLFSVLLLRMWFLQVSAIETSLVAAETQQLRTVTIEAPRGDIYAADGTELMAGTVAQLRLVVDRALVPASREEELIQNLAALLGVPAAEIRATFDERGSGTRFPIGDAVSEATAVFALEHIEDFPGVVLEPVPVRTYPLGETVAHVVGYIGAPSEEDLRRPEIDQNDRVGKFGVEREYDRLVRGVPGSITYRINARGEVLGVVEEVAPTPGGTVITTVDMDVQRVLENALTTGSRLARREGEPVVRAAGVVLDATDGSVVAMASVPSFDPGLFADGRITDEEWETISASAALNNFAIQGLYPPASAFKVVPYTLAIEEGIYPQLENVYLDEAKAASYRARLDPGDPTSFYADGVLLFPETPPLADWTCGALVGELPDLACSLGGHGLVNIHSALYRSVNQYFWGIALEIWNRRSDIGEDLLQGWARTLGFGEITGVDLPFEQAGLVPDREWFQYNQQNDTGLVRPEGGWSGGDLMNIAIGQGAMSVTPLQLANAYAALANGGTLWRPRVVESVRDTSNEVVFTNPASALSTIDISAATVESLRSDLNRVVTDGTAAVAFQDFGPGLEDVGGKTGTGQTGLSYINLEGDEEDITHAWFVGVAPLSNPRWVVAVVIEQGGSGGKIAAPTARRVLQFLVGGEAQMTPIRTGEETER